MKDMKQKKLTFSILMLLFVFSISYGQNTDAIRINRSQRNQTTRGTSTKPSPTQTSKKTKKKTKKTRTTIQTEPATIFTVSSTNASFRAEGGSQVFNVNANKSWRIKTMPPSWAILSINGHTLTLLATENSSTTSRSGYFELASDLRTIRVNISQAGGVNLSASTQDLSFNHLGGTKTISIQTNSSWNISISTKTWGHLTREGNLLHIQVDKNYSNFERTDYIKIIAGEKSLRINITQSGAPYDSNRQSSTTSAYTNYNSYTTSTYTNYNQKKDNYFGGLSIGYIQKQWTYTKNGNKEKMGMFDDDKYLQGIQAGIRIDPQFGWGFGINTGLFYEYCWAKSSSISEEFTSIYYKYNEHGIYLPVDLKYTMNFSKWFQFSVYGGIGFNYVLSGKTTTTDGDISYGDENMFSGHENMKKLNMMIEYGVSIRIKAIQFDFTMSQGLNNWSDNPDMILKQGRPLSVSASYCF